MKQKPKVAKFSANEAKAYDPLRAPKPAHLKRPLRLAVQLFKRWRNIEFSDRKELAPPSIILTTLSGHFYDGEVDHGEALSAILNKTVAVASRQKIRLANPVNEAELISERWEDDQDSYEAFVEAVTRFRDSLRDLMLTRGLPAVTAGLNKLFGEPATRAVKEAFAEVEQARSARSLYTAGPARTLLPAVAAAPLTGAVKVRGNTFHGD